MTDLQTILDQQLNYYKERAEEYDEWWTRVGRHSCGEEKDRKWNDDIKSAQDIVRGWISKEDNVLELACGTGIWTNFLVDKVDVSKMTCVDGSKETIEVLKAKFQLNGIQDKLERVQFEVADLFGEWQPTSDYSVVFFGFFLTHVPPSKMDLFVQKLKRSVGNNKKARIVMIDSYYTSDARATAKDYVLKEGIKAVDYDATAPDDKFLIYRKLNSGATHPIVKVFYEPKVLIDVFAKYGIHGKAKLTPNENFLLANFVVDGQ